MSKPSPLSAFDPSSPAGDLGLGDLGRSDLGPQCEPEHGTGSYPNHAATGAALVRVPPGDPGAPAIRHDGWTPERQAIFLEALATKHNVSKAAKAAGMSRASAYKLRARLKGEPFDLAWDAAFQCSFDALGAAAMDRALNGVERHHYYRGELVGTSRKFDERLTIALLSMRHGFLRDEPPRTDPSAAYDAEDFRGLLARVKQGPETWDGHDDDEDLWKDEAEDDYVYEDGAE